MVSLKFKFFYQVSRITNHYIVLFYPTSVLRYSEVCAARANCHQPTDAVEVTSLAVADTPHPFKQPTGDFQLRKNNSIQYINNIIMLVSYKFVDMIHTD